MAMAPQETTQAAQEGSTSAQQCTCCDCSCSKKAAPGLFVDEELPARWNVLPRAVQATAWLRPHEIRDKPQLFVEGCSRFAVKQGGVGDCSFLAACAAIIEREDLRKQVIPEGQVLYGPGYDGSVTFRLWYQGEWQDVRIDDRIPVDAHGVPVYAHCHHKDEFWLPLLEKAFAKFHKHFGVIDKGGWLSEGLVNLTGYSMQLMHIDDWNVWNIDKNFEKLKNASDSGALILCDTKKKTGPGLPTYHAYTITNVFQHDPQKEGQEKLQLLRVRNPWGTEMKWDGGAWKDGHECWEKLNKEVKESMEYKPECNGEFWMCMKDFTETFNDIVIGTPKPIGAENMKVIGQIAGKWSDDKESGGDHTDIEQFSKNPQFLLVTLGDDEPGCEEDNKETVNCMEGIDAVIELLRSHCRKKNEDSPVIALYIFEACTERRLTADDMLQMTYVKGATEMMKEVAVHSRLRLLPGRRYVVVPATRDPGQAGEFLLRVFSRHGRVHLTELRE